MAADGLGVDLDVTCDTHQHAGLNTLHCRFDSFLIFFGLPAVDDAETAADRVNEKKVAQRCPVHATLHSVT